MKVRIIKSEAWHTGKIGQIFTTTGPKGAAGFVNVIAPGTAYHENGLYGSDYEVVEADPITVADKIVKHEGVEYKVPGWANYLTRDAEGKLVWAWENAPVWNVERQAYYNATPGSGKHVTALLYVRPKPAGCFLVTV